MPASPEDQLHPAKDHDPLKKLRFIGSASGANIVLKPKAMNFQGTGVMAFLC